MSAVDDAAALRQAIAPVGSTGSYRWQQIESGLGGRFHQPHGNGEGQFFDETARIPTGVGSGRIVVKEFIQMRRDRLTFGMMVGIPMVQLILFGFAINSDPKHLPTAVYAADNSAVFADHRLGLAQQQLFRLRPRGEERGGHSKTARRRHGSVCRATSRRIFRATCCAATGPILLLEADATDPAAIGYAIARHQSA